MRDASLSFVEADPAPTSVMGQVITWNLPDLSFLGGGTAQLTVDLPSASCGSRYPVEWTLTSRGPEANRSDNTATTEVFVGRQTFLPIVLKGD